MDFTSFMQSRREALSQAQKHKDSVEVVLGNESCDLDSAVCALAYAFLLQCQNEHTPVIPVLNVLEEDFSLKTEVVYLFLKHGVNQSDLVFINDLDTLREGQGHFKVHLVDHNIPTDSQADLAHKVKSVVDHHHQDCSSDSSAFLRIEVVGSCCSIVTDLFYQRLGSIKSEIVAQLLRGTILGDSICLSEDAGKVRPLDVAMVERLELEFNLDPSNRKTIFQQIQSAKEDVSGFSVEQILDKDRCFISVSAVAVMISCVPMNAKKFLERPGAVSAFHQVLLRHSASVLALICNGGDDGVSVKHFILYTKDNHLRTKLMELVDGDLELKFVETKEFSDVHQITVRRFSDTKISRKQVLPKLKQFLQVVITSDDLLTKLRADSDQLTFSLELSAPGTPAVIDSPAPEPYYSSHENSGSHTPNPTFHVEVPPNSFKDPSMLESFGPLLPSFNNSEMVKRIMIKKNKLGADHMEDCSQSDLISSENNSGNNSCPFTPANSFVDKFANIEHHLPSFNSREMVHRMLQKKIPLVGESGDVSPADEGQSQQIFTPHNSECDGDVGSSPAFDQSDLEHRLSSFEASDLYKSETQRVKDTAHSLVDNALEQAFSAVRTSGDNRSDLP